MKKKMLLATLALLLVGTFGVTLAYYSTQKDFSNVFKTGTYGTTIKEKFVSPANWQPGDETEKRVLATNEGSIPIRVRVSYKESWKAANGTNLDPTFGDPEARIALFDINEYVWLKEERNGVVYYNYNTVLNKNESTSDFISKVTFNPAFALVDGRDYTCTDFANTDIEAGEDGFVGTTCTNTQTGYAGATYTLDIKVETIQADQAEANGWMPFGD